MDGNMILGLVFHHPTGMTISCLLDDYLYFVYFLFLFKIYYGYVHLNYTEAGVIFKPFT
jgi:hypothetical protein